jgi:RNA polymerase sigma factor (sigma-70 family)
VDRELVGAFLAGDTAAIFRIARWVSLELRATAASRRGADREDLIQEGLLRVFKAFSAGNFRAESGLERYVRAVARHAFVDHIRRPPPPPVTDGVDLATLESGEPSVDGALQAGEIADRVLAALPAEEGRLLVEAYVLERPYAELASARGIALSALKVRVFRAVRRAREALAELSAGSKGGGS